LFSIVSGLVIIDVRLLILIVVLENGTENDRAQAVSALVQHIPTLVVDPQGIKVIEKAIKSGGPSAVEIVARRLSEPAKR
jgi:hypothetical protein